MLKFVTIAYISRVVLLEYKLWDINPLLEWGKLNRKKENERKNNGEKRKEIKNFISLLLFWMKRKWKRKKIKNTSFPCFVKKKVKRKKCNYIK